MPVGNDIVDLRDPETDQESLHPRFDARVFTLAERKLIRSSPIGARLRWAIWAAKESAFKAARQMDDTIRFFPRSFAVNFSRDGGIEVVHELGTRFRVWLNQTRDWIHAVARPVDVSEEIPDHGVGEIPEILSAPKKASESVRDAALRALASALSVDEDELRIVSSDGIPRVVRDSALLPLTLSLSHHGRLIAWAWTADGRTSV